MLRYLLGLYNHTFYPAYSYFPHSASKQIASNPVGGQPFTQAHNFHLGW